jgi:predicted N-acyltransferase
MHSGSTVKKASETMENIFKFRFIEHYYIGKDIFLQEIKKKKRKKMKRSLK